MKTIWRMDNKEVKSIRELVIDLKDKWRIFNIIIDGALPSEENQNNN